MSTKKKNYVSVFMIGFVIVLFITLMVGVIVPRLIRKIPFAQGTWYNTNVVTIENGKMTAENNKSCIPVDRPGVCHAHIVWGESDFEPGFLSLMVIRDPQEKTVAWVSGDKVDAQLIFDAKEPGIYTAELLHFASTESFEEALKNVDEGFEIVIGADGSYDGFADFGKEGSWELQYMVDTLFFPSGCR